MAKYDYEFKKKIVNEYMNGEGGIFNKTIFFNNFTISSYEVDVNDTFAVQYRLKLHKGGSIFPF